MPADMLLKDFVSEARKTLAPVYGDREAKAIVSRLCSCMLDIPPHLHITDPGHMIDGQMVPVLENCLARLSACEPLQYVTGTTEFCDLVFRVTPAVLIPRPETEFLCSVLLGKTIPDSGVHAPRILDLCTGSGCIAWTLAHYIPDAQVTGADISEAALEVASAQNIPGNSPKFMKMDILESPDAISARLSSAGLETFDFIVSNPPYVMDKEKRLMGKNVLDYEPHEALFVPDTDPLLFYRAVADIASAYLSAHGQGAVEINEALGEETRDIFLGHGFSRASVGKDLSGRDRFVFFGR